MKKIIILIILILSAFYVYAQDSIIEQVSGTVEIKQPGESTFKIANSGDVIFQQTVISTGFKSLAIIKIGHTSISVRPLTVLTLTEIQNSTGIETLNVNLQSGRVRVDVKPPAGTKAAATVKGPTATASVRGTKFEFDTNNLYVSEGTVSFRGNRGQSFLVSAGGSSHVDESGRAVNPRDERRSNLLPPSPAGTSTTDSIMSGQGAGVSLTIELKFN
jgi:hypothetical protein